MCSLTSEVMVHTCEIPNEGVSTQQGPQDSSWRPEGWGAIPHHCNQLWLETPSSAQCSATGTSWLLFLQSNLVCCGLYTSNFSLLLLLLKLKNVAEWMQLPRQPLWHACQALRTYEPFSCLDGPVLQATATVSSSGHIAGQPPWKPIWNCSSSAQRMPF